MLSLGFRKYATVACPLKKVTVGDKDWDYANEITGCTKKTPALISFLKGGLGQEFVVCCLLGLPGALPASIDVTALSQRPVLGSQL